MAMMKDCGCGGSKSHGKSDKPAIAFTSKKPKQVANKPPRRPQGRKR